MLGKGPRPGNMGCSFLGSVARARLQLAASKVKPDFSGQTPLSILASSSFLVIFLNLSSGTPDTRCQISDREAQHLQHLGALGGSPSTSPSPRASKPAKPASGAEVALEVEVRGYHRCCEREERPNSHDKKPGRGLWQDCMSAP